MKSISKIIDEKNRKKEQARKQRSIAIMSMVLKTYDCAECIHCLSGSCAEQLPKGCEYFEDLVKNRSFRAENPDLFVRFHGSAKEKKAMQSREQRQFEQACELDRMNARHLREVAGCTL